MRIFALLSLISGLFALLTHAVPAGAAERLGFGARIGDSSRLALTNYFQRDISDGLLIAPVDLNEDGLNEFIVRDKDCNPPCTFTILSEHRGVIRSLGDIEARSLALGNQHSKGVRSLLAYQNTANDFDYTVYLWEPDKGRYMMTGQK